MSHGMYRISDKPGWRVNWDNGAAACGTFPIVFDTEEEAQRYADGWYAQFCFDNGLDPEGDHGACAEVIREESP